MPAAQRLPETPVLESARLVLRSVRLEDAPAIQRCFSQWEVVKNLAAHVPWPYPADGAVKHLTEDSLPKLKNREFFLWALTLKSGADELIGVIHLWPDDGKSREMRGFWLDPAYWGQGLMTEAAERVTEYAFMELGWPVLWLRNGAQNLASHRVKEKQGAEIVDRVPARFVGGEDFSIVWRLRREDWFKRRDREWGSGG
jgi:[ribosomal protein S5]-alanine N-acetyltransferase